MMQSDELADEEIERRKTGLVDDVADKPRDDASALSIRGEMRLAACFEVARQACIGVALIFGGLITWARSER